MSAAEFHYIKTVSGKVVAQSIAVRVVSIYWQGVAPFPWYLNGKGPIRIGITCVAHTSPHSAAPWRHCVTSLRSAHWLASSLKLAARCPVSGCWPSCSSCASVHLHPGVPLFFLYLVFNHASTFFTSLFLLEFPYTVSSSKHFILLECEPIPNVIAALGIQVFKMTRSESSVIPFLVPRHKVWLMPTARVPCSNVANTGERKSWMQTEFCTWQNSIRGQQPCKMYI